MKADRLLSVLLLLQAHGRLSSRVVAERLEVSSRTAHRDMEALSAAGVPVFAIRGKKGGWQLEDGWRTRVPALDEAELHALLMAQPRMAGDPRLAASAERAFTKLAAAFPAPLRERAASIRKRLHVDVAGWYGAPENLAALPTVQEAVSRDRMLLIRYRPAGREAADRRVGPLGLVAKGATWYLVASAPNGLRTYRVSRIESATILDEPFERPENFDLPSYWEASVAQFRAAPRYVVVLRLTLDAARTVGMWCHVLPAEPSDPADSDGWATRRISFDNESHACFVVLGLGSRAEVIAPPELRDRVLSELETTLARRSVRHGSGANTVLYAPKAGKLTR